MTHSRNQRASHNELNESPKTTTEETKVRYVRYLGNRIRAVSVRTWHNGRQSEKNRVKVTFM